MGIFNFFSRDEEDAEELLQELEIGRASCRERV